MEENLAESMCQAYRQSGIFAHEDPVRQVVERLSRLDLDWAHALHGGSLPRARLPHYISALRVKEFGHRGTLTGRELGCGGDVAESRPQTPEVR